MTIAGPVQPATVSTDAPIGTRVALRVVVYTPGTLPNGRVVAGGPSLPVYVVSPAQIASGQYVMSGDDAAVPLIVMGDGRPSIGQRPIPVVIVGGSF